jgi:hypothetical protein
MMLKAGPCEVTGHDGQAPFLVSRTVAFASSGGLGVAFYFFRLLAPSSHHILSMM